MPREVGRRGLGKLVIVPIAWLLIVRTAQAYEDQASLDLAGGYTMLTATGPLPQHGAALSVGATLGLGDMFALRAAAGYGPGFGRGAGSFAHGLAELTYLVDLLKVVPFFGVGAGALAASEAPWRLAPAAHGVVGFDYLAARHWLWGIDVRAGVLADDGHRRAFTQVALRYSLLFDW